MPDFATFYIADPTLLGSRVFDEIEVIKTYEGLVREGNATGVVFDIGAAYVRMNFMPPGEIEEHLAGLCGYIHSVCEAQDRLVYTLSRVHPVRFVAGCVIEPGFDDSGIVQTFLLELNRRLNSLLFLWDSLVDFNGQPLIGPMADSNQIS
jgi:hypothetical protein